VDFPYSSQYRCKAQKTDAFPTVYLVFLSLVVRENRCKIIVGKIVFYTSRRVLFDGEKEDFP
jgi:hypothetical protein